MSYANRERRKQWRGERRFERRLAREGSVLVTTWYTKDRIVTLLGDSVLEDFDYRENSPYWHGQSPVVLVNLTPPLQLE